MVRTKIASLDGRFSEPLLPSPEPNTLRRERTPLASPAKTQSVKCSNGTATSTSQSMMQPITKHFYPKFKGRGEYEDADSYIELFESISITNKEEGDDDKLQIFPSLFCKKARSWFNHESTAPAGIDTWAKLRKKFLRRFCELGYDSRILTKLQNFCRGRKKNLWDYIEQFHDLLDRILKTGEGIPYSIQQAIDWRKDREFDDRKPKHSCQRQRPATPSCKNSSLTEESSESKDSLSSKEERPKRKVAKKKKSKRMPMPNKAWLPLCQKWMHW
ncbi:hypothetical protein AXG93_328s1000 [Marchantia polymorpha subsp. ruderalis]|uniref:Retrotransposon gag domain-containing protein n=1 Tax=Marchantia polymorpha subsp. ruderalis TaxID=1480154 RepID=A0A176VP10_MARPO|nr:hypothetical protein AXG93_328s1000 [Marchantia polymorpha subsp. ruderalis]